MIHDYHTLRVVDVRHETRDAISVGLAVPDGLREIFRFAPGQHLAVRAMLGGEDVRRTYSIHSASTGPSGDILWIAIKRVHDGAFSTWARDALQPGVGLDAMPPAGRFVLPRGDGGPRRLIAIAAGSGITPVVGIVEQVLRDEPESHVTLIYGNRTVDDILFRERIEGLKNLHLQRLQVLHVLSRDAEADVPLLAGRIDDAKLRAVFGDGRLTERDPVFLCGPDSLIKTALGTMLSLGVPRTNIHFEYFRAGPQMAGRRLSMSGASPASAIAGAEVVAVVDGMRRTFRVAEGQHVIDAALAQGIKLPYSCKGGMCCTCRAKLVEGEVTMDRNFSLAGWEMEAGFVLTCQARPTTPRVVLDYDQV